MLPHRQLCICTAPSLQQLLWHVAVLGPWMHSALHEALLCVGTALLHAGWLALLAVYSAAIALYELALKNIYTKAVE